MFSHKSGHSRVLEHNNEVKEVANEKHQSFVPVDFSVIHNSNQKQYSHHVNGNISSNRPPIQFDRLKSENSVLLGIDLKVLGHASKTSHLTLSVQN